MKFLLTFWSLLVIYFAMKIDTKAYQTSVKPTFIHGIEIGNGTAIDFGFLINF